MFRHGCISNANGSTSTCTIAVPGLEAPLRCMHLSDSHVDLGPDAESGSLELCDMMFTCYNTGPTADGPGRQQIERRGFPLLPLEALQDLMDLAVAERVDLLLHTGDLINFPSPKAARHAHELLTAGDRQLLYVSGNHDWQHSPPLPGAPDEVRAGGRARALQPFFGEGGDEPSHWSKDIGGVRFIGIDNSSMRVNAEQLQFFERASHGVAVAVLLVHVPLFLPALLEGMGAGMKDGITPLKRTDLFAAPPTAEGPGRADETTLRFADAVARCPSLACVCAGHIHDATSHRVTEANHGLVQYTVDAGCYGGCRILDFVPAPAQQPGATRGKL
jgi:predicted phosphodiesterase